MIISKNCCHSPCGSVDWNLQREGEGDCWIASLPLRECGLKFSTICYNNRRLLSLPLRECGLKYRCNFWLLLIICHSPCGSVDWNSDWMTWLNRWSVTPLAGVWIEISAPAYSNLSVRVTPLAGVWIEILMLCIYSTFALCHSPCGSVDWNDYRLTETGRIIVTPLAGVWIEIGIKLLICFRLIVTPLAGVWIEIVPGSPDFLRERRHSPCGSVDWNAEYIDAIAVITVTPLAGVWIEIDLNEVQNVVNVVTPLAGVWIEIFIEPREEGFLWSLPLRECGLK